MPAEISWLGFDALSKKLARLADPDCSPLMETWERIIVEDNRKGVLEGTDSDGAPMPPLRYRGGTVGKPKGRTKNRGVTSGTLKTGTGANLTTAEYRQLTGPRLAPRREESRVIANLHTGHGRDPADQFRWFAVGAWYDVVSKKGVPFLKFHFNGMG